MKKFYVVLLLLLSTQLYSQYLSNGIGRWKLGVNLGALREKADIKHDKWNFGFGATLEYAVYQKQSSFFGFSLRGRFLNGCTTGQSIQLNEEPISNNAINGIADSSFNYSNSRLFLNNRTKLNEFSFEAMLKWNKLYRNKGLLFYLYIGGGFTNYLVETDQKNDLGIPYDYTLVALQPSDSEMKSFLDGDFETELVNPNYNTTVFTPAIGLGAGFRITRGLDFAWEYKISLPQTDLFDGQEIDNGDPAFIQDMYHYTSLGLIFSIVGHDEPTTYTPPVEPVKPVETTPITNYTTKTEKPTITVTSPTETNFSSPNCKVEIVAKIEHVRNQGDISLYQNGSKVPSYLYFYSKPTFKCKVDLKEGVNNFEIIAKNSTYSTSEKFSLSCNNNEKSIQICNKNNDGTFKEMTIKESEWPTYAAQGATKGTCLATIKTITICLNNQETTIDEKLWPTYSAQGATKGKCPVVVNNITICLNNEELIIDEKLWSSYAAQGATKGKCPTQQVKTITICHIPPTGDKRITMTIPENEWIVHQAHGDFIGVCPAVEPTINICHNNSNGTKTNMSIPEFRWNEHFSHGDIKGNCPEESFIICHKDPATGKKQNISITESLWAQHAAHGDTKGNCPVEENKITICHNIPGKPGQTQTITIPESQWNIHQSHGDQMGACPEPIKYIQICHKYRNTTTNMTIKESEWNLHAAHGDTKGSCPEPIKYIQICHKEGVSFINMTINENDWPQHAAHGDTQGICPKNNSPSDPGTGTNTGNKKITICHQTPGRNAPQTIEILESDWAIHAAHGDSKGTCPDPTIEICHMQGEKKINMTIKESEWPQHAAHGDSRGLCPKDNSTTDPNTGGNSTGSPANTGGSTGHGNSSSGNGEKIKICHYPNGPNSTPETIEIDSSKLREHLLHGDTEGECPSNNKNVIKPNGIKKGKKSNGKNGLNGGRR